MEHFLRSFGVIESMIATCRLSTRIQAYEGICIARSGLRLALLSIRSPKGSAESAPPIRP